MVAMDEPTLALFCALYRSLYELYVYSNRTHARSKQALIDLQAAAHLLRGRGREPEDRFGLLTKEAYAATTTKTH